MIRVKKSPAARTDSPRTDVAVTFALEEQAVPGPVSVVGDFNGWTPGTHVLKKRSNGTRSVVVTLPAGAPVRFRYLADGGVWLDDPQAHAHDEQGSLLHL